MNWNTHSLWVIPALPLVAATLSALAPRRHRAFSATLGLGSVALSFVLCCFALFESVRKGGVPIVSNFHWFQFGDVWLELGWVIDPLSAIMLVMVSLVALVVFIYSLKYMAEDENFTRFFCFLSLFTAAMLGLVIANSLLLLFCCWEIVGVTSYLLIGFWFHKPSAAAAAKKAFIVTRLGDLAFLLGMVWLYSATGTLLFYAHGQGCLEAASLSGWAGQAARFGLAAPVGVALLLFCGAAGKSGQVPLHVWLPDAMEGPTPVSALIHAATMVAAGVFLVARTFPIFLAAPAGPINAPAVVAWVGAITAVFAALIAVAQTDIKRILAYSTISQLGFMMLGLGTGGIAVGLFHLITHAFFKALLFLGAGSVIHASGGEQDIRRMGGLRRLMPVTFAAYAVGMLALSGFPLLFSGFWSKDAILEAAHRWPVSRGPFFLGATAAFLTAFYMTRQVFCVFFGPHRKENSAASHALHESPPAMTVPVLVLAALSVLTGFIGTPAWRWFQAFIEGSRPEFAPNALLDHGPMVIMLMSSALVLAGLGLGWLFYGRNPDAIAISSLDPLERLWPNLFAVLRRKLFVDELYEATAVRFTAWASGVCDWLDLWVWSGVVQLLAWFALGVSWANRFIEDYALNLGFDKNCSGIARSAHLLSYVQNGRVQFYLRLLAIGLVVMVLFLVWGCTRS
jgi:NADH-quinone oxidoreductase subunit L